MIWVWVFLVLEDTFEFCFALTFDDILFFLVFIMMLYGFANFGTVWVCPYFFFFFFLLVS